MLALRLVPGVGDRLFRELIEQIGSASEIFKLPASKLVKISGIGPQTAKAIRNAKLIAEAEKQILKAEQYQSHLYFYSDPAYPERLKNLPDAPSYLFVQGNINLNRKRIVAIVGTRKATSYGKCLTKELVKGLKPYDPLVVSGLAYGIDIQAHTSSLEESISTVGVLGSGLDHIYPSSHRSIAQKMLSNGGLITEELFGSGPDSHNFPSRNRIIAGLSDLVVVVEAGNKGGALITADIMNSYNREVFAYPGSRYNPWSAGCHQLIKQHQAHLITDAEDIALLMNWNSKAHEKTQKNQIAHPDPQSNSILAAFSIEKPIGIEEIQFHTGFSAKIVTSKLLFLELEGRINALPGNQYVII